jgi:hypothetical protein
MKADEIHGFFKAQSCGFLYQILSINKRAYIAFSVKEQNMDA